MMMTVNGTEVDVNVERLDQLIKEYDLKEEHVVAEVDGEIIERSQWNKRLLKPGIKIELIHFVGGG